MFSVLSYHRVMASLLNHLGKKQISDLFADLNYLNIKEYQTFCKKHGIPFYIYVQSKSGLVRTKNTDRKKFVLAKIRDYLKTGNPQKPTIFKSKVVKEIPLKEFKSTTKLHYGQYDKNNPRFIKALKDFTNGQFKNGMIARLVAREFWLDGVAPTLSQFSKAWTKANADNTKRHPEAAYLSDLASGKADKNWKNLRNQKAKAVLNILNKL